MVRQICVRGRVQGVGFRDALRVEALRVGLTGWVRNRSDGSVEALRARYAGRLRLCVNGQADAKRLQQLLAPYRASGSGACLVVISYANDKAACDIALGDGWRVRPDQQLLAELGAWLRPENVQLIYGSS